MKNERLSIEDILTAFQADRVPSRPISAFYRLGLVFVAATMILLPLVYVGIIGAAAYGVYYHATRHIALLESGLYSVVLGYCGPLVVGAILVFFLVKPLFAKPPKPPPPFLLAPGQEPALETFVHQVADAVGAPRPKSIELNCDVNAAAAFRKGFWSIFSQDLKLVIGMPFLGGMTLRSFGGVLAHEFGHFSQGAGMRLTYVIRMINAWFSRVVYDRDQMDVWLARTSGSIDLRLGIILYIARLFIWISRRVLWLLMWFGHTISCFALRQMEYDADSYEVGFAGSDTFGETSHRIQQLGAGNQKTMMLLQETWQQGRITDNLPEMNRLQADGLTPEILDAIRESQKSAKTGIFDTHPCDTDRIRAAESLNQPGIFHLQEPASRLVENYEGLCVTLTRHFYKHVLEIEVKDSNLITNEILAGEEEKMTGEIDAIEVFFGEHFDVTRPVFITSADHASPEPIEALKGQVDALRKEQEVTLQSYSEATEKFLQVCVAQQLLKAGFQLPAADFGLDRANLTSANTRLTQLTHTRDGLAKRLDPLNQAAKTLMVTAIHQSPATLAEATPWLATLKFFERIYPDLLELQDLMARSSCLIEQATSGNEVLPQHYNSMNDLKSKIEAVRSRLRPKLEATPYPFEHAKENINLWELVQVPLEPGTDRIIQVHTQGNAITTQLFRLYQRTLGQLALIAQRALPGQPTEEQETAS